MLSKFNGTSTPKGSYRAKIGDNDCNVNSSLYSLSTALCESIRYQAKSEHNVRQDPIPRVRHGEAATDRRPDNEMKDESAPDLNTRGFEPGTQWSEVECSTAEPKAPRHETEDVPKYYIVIEVTEHVTW